MTCAVAAGSKEPDYIFWSTNDKVSRSYYIKYTVGKLKPSPNMAWLKTPTKNISF